MTEVELNEEWARMNKERQQDREEEAKDRNRNRIVTVLVATLTGATGVVGGAVSHMHDENSNDKPRFEFREFDKSIDENSPVRFYRLDNKTGDVWYPHRNPDKMTAEWILIGGATPKGISSPSLLPTPMMLSNIPSITPPKQ